MIVCTLQLMNDLIKFIRLDTLNDYLLKDREILDKISKKFTNEKKSWKEKQAHQKLQELQARLASSATQPGGSAVVHGSSCSCFLVRVGIPANCIKCQLNCSKSSELACTRMWQALVRLMLSLVAMRLELMQQQLQLTRKMWRATRLDRSLLVLAKISWPASYWIPWVGFTWDCLYSRHEWWQPCIIGLALVGRIQCTSNWISIFCRLVDSHIYTQGFDGMQTSWSQCDIWIWSWHESGLHGAVISFMLPAEL